MPEGHASTRVITTDIGLINHDLIHRPRPYPYDVSQGLTVNDGGASNTFGDYTELIPAGTFDFGDSPNRLQIVSACICDISANGTYLIEFYDYDGESYRVLGAIRFRRIGVFNRSFNIWTPCRDFDNDSYALYARVKSDLDTGESVTFSLHVARHIHTSYNVEVSAGVFPLG